MLTFMLYCVSFLSMDDNMEHEEDCATSAILTLAERSHGTLSTAQAQAAGIHRGTLHYLAKKGELTHAARGLWLLPDAWEDPFFIAQQRFQRGIFSLGSALFLADLTDRTPERLTMTFPAGYNLSGAKAAGLHCVTTTPERYPLGLIERTTPIGHTVRVYSPERTLCDLLNPRLHADIQLISQAFRRYLQSPTRNLPLLSSIATTLRVAPRLQPYLEVLL